MDKIRILLLDDHALFREGLGRLLESEPDLKMAACCASVAEATDILRQKPIDLILLDYDLGKERGFEFITQAREWGFQGRFLMVTAGMGDAETVRALDLGVGGIFPKHSSPIVLVEAIRKVMAGETWLDENAIQALLKASKQQDGAARSKPFTERESEVLQGVFEGLGNKEIGSRLNISESSVKAALQQLFQKTGVRTRSQLVRIALEEHGTNWK
jgi:DNA-binding NarL/FixJ family response regulator